MIRQPSTKASQYAWWRAAIAAGGDVPRHEGVPECGWFKHRAIKGGPFLPARIWLHQEIDPETGELMADEVMHCEVLGARRDPAKIWTYLRPITRAAYAALIDLHVSMDMMAATNAAIDITKVNHAKPKPQWRF